MPSYQPIQRMSSRCWGRCVLFGSNGPTNPGVHVYLDRHASCMPVGSTHKPLNISKTSYGITQNVIQTQELALACVFGLWTRDPGQRPLGNGVWKWYETLPLTTSVCAHPLSFSRTPTTLPHNFCLVWRPSTLVRTNDYQRTSGGRLSWVVRS